ncbi:hypothetical protein V6Z11_D05G431200 [Gossypium hirsutum]
MDANADNLVFLNLVEPSGMIGHVLPLFCPSLIQFDPKTTLHLSGRSKAYIIYSCYSNFHQETFRNKQKILIYESSIKMPKYSRKNCSLACNSFQHREYCKL